MHQVHVPSVSPLFDCVVGVCAQSTAADPPSEVTGDSAAEELPATTTRNTKVHERAVERWNESISLFVALKIIGVVHPATLLCNSGFDRQALTRLKESTNGLERALEEQKERLQRYGWAGSQT